MLFYVWRRNRCSGSNMQRYFFSVVVVFFQFLFVFMQQWCAIHLVVVFTFEWCCIERRGETAAATAAMHTALPHHAICALRNSSESRRNRHASHTHTRTTTTTNGLSVIFGELPNSIFDRILFWAVNRSINIRIQTVISRICPKSSVFSPIYFVSFVVCVHSHRLCMAIDHTRIYCSFRKRSTLKAPKRNPNAKQVRHGELS